MQNALNPYESSVASCVEISSEEIRRPQFGTFLIWLWLLEGGFKAYFIVTIFLRVGRNPIRELAENYPACNPFVFGLVAAFLIIETIGPWVGIYYLTGRRSRTIPFHTALWQTLKVAGGMTLIATFVLLLYCEIVGSRL